MQCKQLANDARGGGEGNQEPGSLLTHDWQDGASDVHRPEQQSLDLSANLFGTELLKEAGEEVPGVVYQDVDPAESLDGGLHGRLGITRASDVEFD